MDGFVYLLASACAVVIILTLHEFAHAFAAYKCGDPTAKWEGRLTLNPLRHFDVAGLLMFILVGFGWARPVPINPNNFRHYKAGLLLTAVAGVAVNLLLAFLFYPVMLLVVKNLTEANYLYIFLNEFSYLFVLYNLNFFVFNLLPLYPLDGFRVWDALDRRRGKAFLFVRQYGYYILLGLILESYLCNFLSDFVPYIEYFNILGYYLRFVINGLYKLFGMFWGLFI